jgi:phage terminase large subunit GpA-like protein
MTATDFAVPKLVRLINVGVDFQIDRCELEFIGWGEGEETWGLGYFVLPGDFSQMYQKGRPWAYDQLESILTREFIREDGARLTVCCGGFDTGYAACQRALYQYLRPRYGRRYFALKGASQKWAPIWAQGRRDERIRLFIIGTNRAKAAPPSASQAPATCTSQSATITAPNGSNNSSPKILTPNAIAA